MGLTVTNLTPGLPQSDPLREPPFQGFIVAGGVAATGGGGTTNLDVMFVNTETAETSTADRASFGSLDIARAWHTATQLYDGRVLFTGGIDENGVPTNTTEIFDPPWR